METNFPLYSERRKSLVARSRSHLTISLFFCFIDEFYLALVLGIDEQGEGNGE